MSGNIYLFIGEEYYLIRSRINKIIKDSNAGEYNATKYDLEEVNVSEAIQDAQTLPFMSDSKVVVIKNPIFLTSQKGDVSQNVNSFIKYLLNPAPTCTLIIDAFNLKLDERKDVVKKLKKVAIFKECKAMTNVEFKGWLRRKLEINGIKISNEAIDAFYERAGNNLENAENEADKLISYVDLTKEVTTEDVLKLVIKEMDTNVFSLSNAIIAKDKEKSLNVYNDLLLSGQDPVTLLSLSSRALRESYLVQLLLQENYSQGEIAREMRVSNGKAYYLMKNAKSLVKENVEYFIHRFAELDYKIKRGMIDSKTGFEFLLFEI